MIKNNLMTHIDSSVEEYIDENHDQLNKINMEKDKIIKIRDEVLNLIKKEFGNNIVDLDENYIKTVNSKIYQTKKRWKEKEIKGKHGLIERIEKVELLYETAPNIKERFNELYGVSNLCEFRTLVLDELELWYSNDDASLLSFEYIKDKHGYQIERAIFNDIQRLIAMKIISNKNNNNNKPTLEMPETLNSVAFNFSRDKNIRESMELSSSEDLFRYIYEIDDESSFETIIGAETLKSDIISEVLKNGITNVLSFYDMKVFLYIISQRESNFFIDGKITIPLVNIVRDVYPSDNSAYYEKCRVSLHKMAHQRFSALTKNSRGLTIGIIDSVFIGKKSAQGVEMVEVTMSEAIVSDLLKRRTIKLYKDSILNLKEPASQVLVFTLQSRRVNYFSDENNDAEIEEVALDISFFKNALFFSNSRTYENIKIIERSLNEIIENKLIVSSYKRQGYTFYVKFLPFAEEERRDLLEEVSIDNKEIIEIPSLSSNVT